MILSWFRGVAAHMVRQIWFWKVSRERPTQMVLPSWLGRVTTHMVVPSWFRELAIQMVMPTWLRGLAMQMVMPSWLRNGAMLIASDGLARRIGFVVFWVDAQITE